MERFLTLRGRAPFARAAFMAVALLATTCLSHAEEARPLRGVAMVIGNSEYETLPALANPANDARAVEMLLSALGFETELSSDRDARRLARDLDIFIEDAEGADVAILYYAGHGIEAGGENFLVPVDADLSALDAAGEKLVPISAYVEQLQATVPVVIVMLDACRDNPFPADATVRLEEGAEPLPMGEGGLGETRGATRIAPKGPEPADNYGTVIAFAAEPGHAALDGDPGGNSPYTAAILRHLETMAGEEFGLVMRMVAEEVYLKTAGRQRPWINESLRRLLYFGAAPEPVAGAEGEILTERRQLLVTISALPMQGRNLVEQVAGDRGVPMDALFAMLNTLGESLPDDPAELDRLLRRLADDLKLVLEERSALKSSDPEIMRLSELARTATAEGALTTAVSLYEQAKARIGELEKTVASAEDDIRDRRIEFAEVYARSGEARALALDHLGAASDFAEAAEQVDRWDEAASRLYLLAQARALIDHGILRGDTPALERAVDLLGQLAQDAAAGTVDVQVNLALADALAELGNRRTTNETLERAVDTYRTLMTAGTDIDRAAIQRKLGGALLALGRRDIGPERLREAVQALDAASELSPREAEPRQWAQIQTGLGEVRLELWRRDDQGNELDRAIAHYRAALEVFDPDASTASWASAQLGLGAALRAEGLRIVGALPGTYFGFFADEATEETRQAAGFFRQSDAAFEAALTACERAVYPVCWARAQHGRAVALYSLGSVELDDREAAFSQFRRSMEAFEAALGEQRFEMSPLGWAETYASRAEMLQRFAMRSAAGITVIYLAEAAKGYKEALAAITADSLPAMWFDLNDRLAGVYDQMLDRDGRRQAMPRHARGKVEHLRASLSVIDRASDGDRWLSQTEQLAEALLRLGRLTDEVAPIEEALSLRAELGLRGEWLEEQWLGEALLKMAATHEAPHLARAARNAFENAWDSYYRKATRHDFDELAALILEADKTLAAFETATLEGAVERYRALLAKHPRTDHPQRWAHTQYDLAALLKVLGERANDAALLRQSADAYRAALEIWTLKAGTRRHGLAQEQLGDTLVRIGEQGGGVPLYRESAAAYEAALSGLTLQSTRFDHARLNRKLADRLYFSIGLPENDIDSLKQAILRYRAALEVDTVEDSPSWFTALQRAVGDVAMELVWRGQGGAYAAEAVQAYRLAASLGDRMGDLKWRTENEEKIANALLALGEAERDNGKLNQAVMQFQRALAMRIELGDPIYEAYARADFGRALYVKGYNNADVASLARSVDELRRAARVFESASMPDSVLWVTDYIAYALTDIAALGGGRIDEALAAYDTLLQARPREEKPDEWAKITHNSAYLHMLAAGPEGTADEYEQALAMARESTALFEQGDVPLLTALGNNLLCKGQAGLARARADIGMARTAVETCRRAMPTILTDGDPQHRRNAQDVVDEAAAVLAELEAKEARP